MMCHLCWASRATQQNSGHPLIWPLYILRKTWSIWRWRRWRRCQSFPCAIHFFLIQLLQILPNFSIHPFCISSWRSFKKGRTWRIQQPSPSPVLFHHQNCFPVPGSPWNIPGGAQRTLGPREEGRAIDDDEGVANGSCFFVSEPTHGNFGFRHSSWATQLHHLPLSLPVCPSHSWLQVKRASSSGERPTS